MKIKIIFVLLILLSLQIKSQEQTRGEGYTLPDFTPIAPKEQEFVKYMACPVSEYTGVPNIQIPIYTIKITDVEVPINLSYYAKGIKVNQEASWVGLGWDLNIGGNVIQKVQDRDDLDNYQLKFRSYRDICLCSFCNRIADFTSLYRFHL